MQEPDLRRWHRQLGIALAIFIIAQAGTGLILNLEELKAHHAHEQGDQGAPDTDDAPSPVTMALEAVHQRGGVVGAIYRILLGSGLVIQTLTGIMIFSKIRSRSKGRKPKGINN